jgi:hypothetical protein
VADIEEPRLRCEYCGTEMSNEDQTWSGERHWTEQCREYVKGALNAERVEHNMTATHLAHATIELETARKVIAALKAAILFGSVEHDDPECPQDDTCECEHIAALNNTIRAYDEAGKS